MRQRRGRIEIALRRFGFLLILLVAWFSLPLSASAHARLTSSEPAPGSSVGRMPATITLSFSEPVDPGYCSASLLASDGARIAIAALVLVSGGNASLAIDVPNAAAAPKGDYTLVWRSLSATDGHVATGTVTFSAGTGATPANAAGAGESTRPPWWRVLIRWLEIASLLVVAGGFAFIALVPGEFQTARAEPRRVLTATSTTLLVALALSLYDQTLVLASRRVFDPPPVSVFRNALLDSSSGRPWIARAVLAVCMLALARVAAAKPVAAWLGLAAVGGALLTRSMSGHAAGSNHGLLATGVDWLHLAAIGVWLGGLLFLAIMIRATADPELVASLVSRFSKFALGAVTLIIATGLISAALHIAGPRSLRSSDYGVVLIAKHLLFAPVLIAAGVNLLIVIPRLKAAMAAGQWPRASALVNACRSIVLIELTFSVFVLLAASTLTELAPADGPLAVDVASRITAIDQSASAGDLTVQLIGRLSGAAEDRYIVSVLGSDERAIAAVQRLIVVTSDAADNAIGDRFDAQALPGSTGSFFFPAVRIGLAATWNVTIIVRRAGLEDVQTGFRFDAGAGAVQPPRLMLDHWRWPRLTIASYLLAPVAVLLFVAGVIGVRRLPGLEPIAGALILTMTGLIAAGFMIQAVRATVPITPGAALVNPNANDPGAIARGAGLYTAYCLACHGPAGEGVNAANSVHSHGAGAGLLDRSATQATDGDLYWQISMGVARTSMPAFDHALSETERWDLVRYLRELQKRDGRPE